MAKWWRRIFALGVAAAALALMTAGPGVAEDDDGRTLVVPPGQDELVADMLGYGVELAGECHFTGGKADGPIIRASYDCADGEVILQLEHPSAAPEAAFSTDRFALTIAGGTAPEALVAELLLRLQAGEESFTWQPLDSDSPAE